MVEKFQTTNEFELNSHRERERKLLPLFPDELTEFRRQTRPIEQFYLSHPSEPFSLRFRESFDEDGNLVYTAALKDRGELTKDGLDRLEVEVEISPELYKFYTCGEIPVMHKLRHHANSNVIIDYYEDGHIQVESENDDALSDFKAGYGNTFIDVTGDRAVDNEWRAHMLYMKSHGGNEALLPQPGTDIDAVVTALMNATESRPITVAQICGRSGSGKSTIVRKLQESLVERGVESIVVSTDDYHRGGSCLKAYNHGKEWAEWDHPIVYDTAALQKDLVRLLADSSIVRRTIDFGTGEPVILGELQPAPVILIEGIYAGSNEFEAISQLRIDVPTPLATCIGRRLLRDLKERPQFADLSVSFAYMLEQAEPMWRSQVGE